MDAGDVTRSAIESSSDVPRSAIEALRAPAPHELARPRKLITNPNKKGKTAKGSGPLKVL